MKRNPTKRCEAEGESVIRCSGAVARVMLRDPDGPSLPQTAITLCRGHRQLFTDEEEKETAKSAPFAAFDSHMSFLTPEMLEGVAHRQTLAPATAGYGQADEFAYLKKQPVNLEAAALTDKQLTAVCLVFFGGVKKKTAARAMKISAQAVSDHIKAALKKIEETIR